MDNLLLLRFAYGANILILLPVVASLLIVGTAPVFGPVVDDSPALRLLVAALWGAILLCSVIGLAFPRVMIGILALQVIYKSGWLLTYVLSPSRTEPVPWGPAIVFAIIVLVWPIILFRQLP